MNDKYVVFKREELLQTLSGDYSAGELIAFTSAVSEVTELEGCFVIRTQDMAAPAGLRGYVNGLMIVEETLSAYGHLTDEMKAHLHRSIEVAMERAEEAELRSKKIPD